MAQTDRVAALAKNGYDRDIFLVGLYPDINAVYQHIG
ncbi:hypothetical protein ABIA51_002461 [Erwinia aphidicola]|jgi:hypothetical protein